MCLPSRRFLTQHVECWLILVLSLLQAVTKKNLREGCDFLGSLGVTLGSSVATNHGSRIAMTARHVMGPNLGWMNLASQVFTQANHAIVGEAQVLVEGDDGLVGCADLQADLGAAYLAEFGLGLFHHGTRARRPGS